MKKLVPLILFLLENASREEILHVLYCTVPEEKGDKTPDIIRRNFTIQHNRSGRTGPGGSKSSKGGPFEVRSLLFGSVCWISRTQRKSGGGPPFQFRSEVFHLLFLFPPRPKKGSSRKD